jgi:uncharacterized protein
MDKMQAFQVMIKPIGPVCNLNCEYCYYLEKDGLYKENKNTPSGFAMSPDILEKCIRDYIESQTYGDILFSWQGGEPTMLGMDFFKKAIEIQNKYSGGKRISNSIQTNGTLITEDWAGFLADNNFLLGLSIDGPSDLHDYHRKYPSGKGSFSRIMKTVDLIHRYKIEFNTITTVNSRNSRMPVKVYRFLKEIGSRYMQFIPVVERESNKTTQTSMVTEASVEPLNWGKFLARIFDEWVRIDIGQHYVNYFDNTLAPYVGEEPPLCTTRMVCGDNLVLEHNGDVYSCDHYVYPKYMLGNINNAKLYDIANDEFQLDFGQDKINTLPRECLDCEFLKMCGGDCPKHRFTKNDHGEMISYLHEGFLYFYRHADKYMNMMAAELRQRRPPENIMNTFPEKERQKLLKQIRPGMH